MNIATTIMDGLREIASYGPFWVSLVVAFIGYQQWRTARDKARFDLYEKRFVIFQATLDFIGEVCSDAVRQEQVVKFDIARNEAFFLFGRDKGILDYLQLLRQKAQDHQTFKSQAEGIPGPPNPERSHYVQQMLKIKEWFFNQPDVARTKFAAYLSFKK